MKAIVYANGSFYFERTGVWDIRICPHKVDDLGQIFFSKYLSHETRYSAFLSEKRIIFCIAIPGIYGLIKDF